MTGAGTVKVIDRDLGWQKIRGQIYKLRAAYTEVGLWGTGDDHETNLAARGAVNEFGSAKEKIPARPWMRQAFEKYGRNLNSVINTWYSRVQTGQVGTLTALKNIGEYYAGRLKKIFTEGNFKPNAPRTILSKGSSQPLIDTGDMRRAITHKEFIR